MEELKKRRKTIAFFTTSIAQPTVTSLYKGIVERCKEVDINLITVNGERLREKHNYHYHCNKLYDFITEKNTDAIISWASAIGTYLSDDELKDFHDKFKNIPIVTLSKKIEGYPAIIVDNYYSMKELVLHLIKKHKYKNIAFIRGPENYFYAEERLRAYKDAIKESNIEINELLITNPALFVSRTGKIAIQYFLDELRLTPKKDIDAIVAVSDEIAIVAMKELQARGIKIPEEIAIVGFNNNITCKSISPALSSVEIFFDKLGKTAVDKCIDIINGKNFDDITVIKTTPVMRESCGCKKETSLEVQYGKIYENCTLLSEQIEKNRNTLFKELTKELSTFLSEKRSNIIANRIIERVIDDLKNRNMDIFINSFREILTTYSIADNFDFFLWEDIITILFNNINSYNLNGCDDVIYLNKLIHQSRIAIQLTKRYFFISKKLTTENLTSHLLSASQNISATTKEKELIKVLIDGFMLLDIEEAYIFKFTDTAAINILSYVNKETTKKIKIKDKEYIPSEILTREDRADFIIMSLYFKAKNIGYIIFKYNSEKENRVYPLLRAQISSAIESITTLSLLKKAEKKQKKLFEETQQKHKELDKTTKELWGEMELPKKLQITILPEKTEAEGYKIDSVLIPAEDIRGAYYDLINIHKDKNLYWLNIGDVSGNGVTVGIILMMIQTCNIDNIMHNQQITPDKLLINVNSIIYHALKNRLKIDNIASSCYLKFDKDGNFLYSGIHEKILIYRKSKNDIEEIQTKGIPLGVVENIAPYITLENFKLEKGDTMLLYTKGVLMMKSFQNAKSSRDKLKEVFKNIAESTPSEIISNLVYEFYEFKEKQTDDIGIVVIKKE